MQKSHCNSREKQFNSANDTIKRLRSNETKSFLSERLRDNLEKKVRALLLNICHEVEKKSADPIEHTARVLYTSVLKANQAVTVSLNVNRRNLQSFVLHLSINL